jgi:hypothetical protein
MLTDGFGRGLSGIRISLTDRCNFDCVYCHNEGLGDTRGPMEPADEELSTDEVVRILEVAADLGVTAAKFTGGEPMLREDLEGIVRRTPDAMETSITTNGTFLPGRAAALAAGKVVVMAVPRLRTPEPFLLLDPDLLEVAPRKAASSSGGSASSWRRPHAPISPSQGGNRSRSKRAPLGRSARFGPD